MSEIPRGIVDKAQALHQATRTEIPTARKRNQFIQPRLPEPKVHRLPGRLEADAAPPKRTRQPPPRRTRNAPEEPITPFSTASAWAT